MGQTGRASRRPREAPALPAARVVLGPIVFLLSGPRAAGPAAHLAEEARNAAREGQRDRAPRWTALGLARCSCTAPPTFAARLCWRVCCSARGRHSRVLATQVSCLTGTPGKSQLDTPRPATEAMLRLAAEPTWAIERCRAAGRPIWPVVLPPGCWTFLQLLGGAPHGRFKVFLTWDASTCVWAALPHWREVLAEKRELRVHEHPLMATWPVGAAVAEQAHREPPAAVLALTAALPLPQQRLEGRLGFFRNDAEAALAALCSWQREFAGVDRCRPARWSSYGCEPRPTSIRCAYTCPGSRSSPRASIAPHGPSRHCGWTSATIPTLTAWSDRACRTSRGARSLLPRSRPGSARR